MTVATFTDARAFLDAAAPLLAADPISTNVIAVVTEQLASVDPAPPEAALWFIVSVDARVTGAAMVNGPWNLFVSAMPQGAAARLAEHVVDVSPSIPGVTGEATAVDEFVAAWSEPTGRRARRAGGRHVYVLDDLDEPDGIAGAARRFDDAEVPLVADWLTAFHDEAVADDPDIDTQELAEQRIGQGEIWAWTVAGEPVALAACSAPTVGVARVGPVYSPPERRRHGYGAAVTAAATRSAFDAGAARVMLYADVDNPTSNGIYQRLGFRFDHDAEQYQFD